jgi:hypothetical protein
VMRISQPNSKSYLVIPFGSAGTELGLLYIRDIAQPSNTNLLIHRDRPLGGIRKLTITDGDSPRSVP